MGGVSFWVKEEVAEITSPRGQLQKKLKTLHHLDPGMQGRCCASDSQKVGGGANIIQIIQINIDLLRKGENF